MHNTSRLDWISCSRISLHGLQFHIYIYHHVKVSHEYRLTHHVAKKTLQQSFDMLLQYVLALMSALL